MGLQLDQIVPWGRSFEEYGRMFALDERDLSHRILDCAAGPAGFNAGMHARGRRVVSCDPLYAFSADQIRQRIDQTCQTILAGARANRDDYVWTTISSPEALGELRMAAMNRFLEDFPAGAAQGRYLPLSLPRLGLRDGSFELALCSHFLFTYSDQLSLDFHRASILELCRVAAEVRIFPLLTMDGRPSPQLPPLLDCLAAQGSQPDVVKVDYQFQKGGNQMLVVRAPRVLS